MHRGSRVLTPDFPIHITGRCNNREAFPVPLDEAWEIFSNWLHLLRFQFDVHLHVFVLMPNHFHLLCRDPNLNLSKGMACFLRETSREMAFGSHRINRIWGRRFHNTNVRGPLQYLHASKYIYRNPVAARLCERVEEYPWSSLPSTLGMRKSIIPLETDENLIEATEQTLRWLNQPYQEREIISIKSAFKKREFVLSPDAKLKRQTHLNDWSSVPFIVPSER